jgi:hypothetical protein
VLVDAARAWGNDELALAQRCAADEAMMRRLHHTAARRLHPDRNAGRHLDEWTQLQNAISVLRRERDDDSGAAITPPPPSGSTSAAR